MTYTLSYAGSALLRDASFAECLEKLREWAGPKGIGWLTLAYVQIINYDRAEEDYCGLTEDEREEFDRVLTEVEVKR